MTTIAWDGKTLAGDRRMSCHLDELTFRRNVRKVFKFTHKDGNQYLVGGAGEKECATQYIEWIRTEKKSEPPQGNCTMIVVNREPVTKKITVHLIQSTLQKDVKNDVNKVDFTKYQRTMAIGGGAHFALGALEAGATARQAVKIASKYDVGTGGGVDSVSFG